MFVGNTFQRSGDRQRIKWKHFSVIGRSYASVILSDPAKDHLKDCGGKFLLQCNPDLTILKNGIPPFYLNCLKSWFSLQPPITSYEADIICNEIVWNNKCILIDKNTVYSKSLKQKGLVKLNDLLSSQGGFAKTNELLSREFTHAEAFSIMSYQDAIPEEWRKKLKQNICR